MCRFLTTSFDSDSNTYIPDYHFGAQNLFSLNNPIIKCSFVILTCPTIPLPLAMDDTVEETCMKELGFQILDQDEKVCLLSRSHSLRVCTINLWIVRKCPYRPCSLFIDHRRATIQHVECVAGRRHRPVGQVRQAT